MIPAAHRRWASAVFIPYIYHLFRSDFASVRLVGSVPSVPDGASVLLLGNHSSWWDGFFVWLVNELYFRRRFHVMMLEDQLRRYWFFRYLGAYSIDPGGGRSVVESLSYTADILSQKDMLVSIFPQGEIEPNRRRPLLFRRGAERVVQGVSEGDVFVVPVAFRVELTLSRRPDLFIAMGSAVDAAGGVDIAAAARSVQQLLDDIDASASVSPAAGSAIPLPSWRDSLAASFRALRGRVS